MIRLFIALKIPEDFRAQLLQLINHQKWTKPVRWLASEQIHLTLRFLGNVAEEKVPAVCEALKMSANNSSLFRLCLEGGGVFPHVRSPRVFWVGVGGDKEPLRRLFTGTDEALSQLGFEKEERAFVPHVTVGRNKIGKDSLQDKTVGNQFCKLFASYKSPFFEVKQVILYQSHLNQKGAQYEEKASFPLRSS